MNKQIVHISIHQTSKVLGLMFALVAFVFALVVFVLSLFTEHHVGTGLLYLILTPLFVFIYTYIFYAIGFYFYNVVAKRTGGIEFDLTDVMKVEEVAVVEKKDI